MLFRASIRLSAILAAALAARADPAASAWDALRRLDLRQAAAQAQATDDSPRSLLFRALVLANRQPKTDGDARAAIALCERTILSAPPRERAAAGYLKGRILQWHLQPNPLTEAVRVFEETHRRDPGEPFGELALLQSCVIRYASEPDPARLGDAIAADLPRIDTLRLEAVRRNALRAAGEALLSSGGDRRRALDLFERALAGGFESDEAQGDLLLRVAVLSSEFGRGTRAREAFLDFAGAFPRDARARWARDRAASER